METVCCGARSGAVRDAPPRVDTAVFPLGHSAYIIYNPHRPPVLLRSYGWLGGFPIEYVLCDSSMGLECFFSPVDVEVITANTPLECVSNVSQNFFQN